MTLRSSPYPTLYQRVGGALGAAISAVRYTHSSTKRQSVDKLPQADILSRTASQPLPTLGVSFHSAPIAQG